MGQNAPLFCLNGKSVDSIELEKRLTDLTEAAGLHLISAHWTPIRGRQMLKVVADAEDHNISIDECAMLSRSICDLLDSYPHEFPDYRLEVSSPGLKHPLEKWQFQKNRRRKVDVHFEEDGQLGSVQGTLQEVDENGFFIQTGGNKRRFEFDHIKRVYVLPEI